MRAVSIHQVGIGESSVGVSGRSGNFEHERRMVEAVRGSSFAAVWYAWSINYALTAKDARNPLKNYADGTEVLWHVRIMAQISGKKILSESNPAQILEWCANAMTRIAETTDPMEPASIQTQILLLKDDLMTPDVIKEVDKVWEALRERNRMIREAAAGLNGAREDRSLSEPFGPVE
jgi:hypothetical protein